MIAIAGIAPALLLLSGFGVHAVPFALLIGATGAALLTGHS